MPWRAATSQALWSSSDISSSRLRRASMACVRVSVFMVAPPGPAATAPADRRERRRASRRPLRGVPARAEETPVEALRAGRAGWHLGGARIPYRRRGDYSAAAPVGADVGL